MSSTLRHYERLRLKHCVEISIRLPGSNAGVGLQVVPARSTAKVVGSNGSFSIIEVADWLIRVDEWEEFSDVPPFQGCVITAGSGGGESYIVGHPDINTPAFSNFNQLDRPALVWRVHSIPD